MSRKTRFREIDDAPRLLWLNHAGLSLVRNISQEREDVLFFLFLETRPENAQPPDTNKFLRGIQEMPGHPNTMWGRLQPGQDGQGFVV